MAIRQPQTIHKDLAPKPKIPREPPSESDDSASPEQNQPNEESSRNAIPVDEDEDEDEEEDIEEYHTDLSSDAELDEKLEEDEYHTDDPEDVSDYAAQALPLELLRSKPNEAPARSPVLQWDGLTQKQKKAMRDEMGISMRELREEALRTGALQAGFAAQTRRGVRPVDKVAGSRVTKKKKKKSSRKKAGEIVLSGKQRLLEQRMMAPKLEQVRNASRKSGKGSIRSGRENNKS